MKRNEIDVIFTEKVAEYISEGYTINSNSMSGSQGEIAKVDLVKGKTLLRVWLNKESIYNWTDNTSHKFHGNVMVLRVGKWNRDAIQAKNGTVWMNDCETIYQEVYYEVRHGSDYYVSEEEAIEAQIVRKDRRIARKIRDDIDYDITDKARHLGESYLRRKIGYKRISSDKIKVVRCTRVNSPVKYDISYNGMIYKLK